MDQNYFLFEAFKCLKPDHTGVVNLHDAIHLLKDQGLNDYLIDILIELKSLFSEIVFDDFKSFFCQKYKYTPADLSSDDKFKHKYEDINIPNKYEFLSEEFNEGKALDVECLMRIKEEIENDYKMDKLLKMIDYAASEEDKILSYDDFKDSISLIK